jgi:hypothetical protein
MSFNVSLLFFYKSHLLGLPGVQHIPVTVIGNELHTGTQLATDVAVL